MVNMPVITGEMLKKDLGWAVTILSLAARLSGRPAIAKLLSLATLAQNDQAVLDEIAAGLDHAEQFLTCRKLGLAKGSIAEAVSSGVFVPSAVPACDAPPAPPAPGT